MILWRVLGSRPPMKQRRFLVTIGMCGLSITGLLLIFTLIQDPLGTVCRQDDVWVQDETGATYELASSCVCVASGSLGAMQDRIIYPQQDLLKEAGLKCALTSKPTGRLGNLMGEYATLYALAVKNGRPAFVLPQMAEKLQNYFHFSLPVLNTSFAKQIPWEPYRLNDWMQPAYHSLPAGFVRLEGYPCSWMFYHHMRKDIIREFTFHDSIIKNVNTYLHTIKGNRVSATFIGVHVRRGDYIELMNGLYNGVLASPEYLQQAMQYYRNKYLDSVFVVCSDDLDWCKNNIDSTKGDVYFGWNGRNETPGEDMALLAHCNHSVMTIGTFGYWSSYLAGGEVVYLSNYTSPNSVFLKVFKYEAAYLPEWIGIPANVSWEGRIRSSSNIKSGIHLSALLFLLFLCYLRTYIDS